MEANIEIEANIKIKTNIEIKTNVDIKTNININTIKEETNLEDNIDLFIISSFILFNLILIIL